MIVPWYHRYRDRDRKHLIIWKPIKNVYIKNIRKEIFSNRISIGQDNGHGNDNGIGLSDGNSNGDCNAHGNGNG